MWPAWENENWKPWLKQAARWLPLAVVILWAYYNTFYILVYEWIHQPDYSHGFFVPIFAGWLLWHRRAMLAPQPPAKPGAGESGAGGNWWGLAFFALTAALLIGASVMYLVYFERLSLLPTAAGVALFVGGWRGLKWSWPAVVFLIFMIPLPGPLLVLLSYPLQRLAALIATFLLQFGGIPAFAQGNTVTLREGQVDVGAAYSGLRILMLCITICVGTVMIHRRRWLEVLVIVVSAVPIALFANITRITITALAYELMGHQEVVEKFHDVAGYLMMPGAMVLLWGELALLARLLPARPKTVPYRKGFAA